MMTIDHMRVDYEVTVIQEFVDAAGTTMRPNESGIIRDMSWDQLRDEITIGIEREPSARLELLFSLAAKSGPRNGHMREFFEIGEYKPVPRAEPVRPAPAERKMIALPPDSAPTEGPAHWRELRNTEGPDRLEDAEKALRAEIQHIGVASSIAEMYAQRMRAFQAEGNEVRAIAAFKLATEWMSTYAGWATSGGEGAALSLERDLFHEALVKEFGYDPTLGDN